MTDRAHRTEVAWPEETVEQLLDRIEAEHGPEARAIVAADLERDHPHRKRPREVAGAKPVRRAPAPTGIASMRGVGGAYRGQTKEERERATANTEVMFVVPGRHRTRPGLSDAT